MESKVPRTVPVRARVMEEWLYYRNISSCRIYDLVPAHCDRPLRGTMQHFHERLGVSGTPS